MSSIGERIMGLVGGGKPKSKGPAKTGPAGKISGYKMGLAAAKRRRDSAPQAPKYSKRPKSPSGTSKGTTAQINARRKYLANKHK